jgi:hypothetical protein
MLQGASEERITGRTHIFIGYWSSKAVCSPLKMPKAQGKMKMLSKGTCIQNLKYYYLSDSSCFWISFMAIRRIFKDN